MVYNRRTNYKKTMIKCSMKIGHRPSNHVIKATVIWEPKDKFLNFWRTAITGMKGQVSEKGTKKPIKIETNGGFKHNAFILTNSLKNKFFDNSA